MKPNLKRRVQAQRKFAQGAYIPPQNNNTMSGRMDVNLTPAKEDRSIIHNNLSAKNLLDIVSFQSMHTHSKPVVLLERMAPVKEPSVQNARDIPPKPQSIPSENLPSKPRLKLAARNSTMCLRSQSRVPHNPRTRLPLKRLTRSKRQQRLKQGTKLNLILKRNSNKTTEKRGSTSDLDDETPLKYFKNKQSHKETVTSPEKPADLGRVTRSSTNTDKSNDFDTAPAKRAEPIEQSDKIAASPVKQSKPKAATKQEQVHLNAEVQNIKTFKEPAVPTRFSKPKNVNPIDSKKVTTQKTNEVTDQEVVAALTDINGRPDRQMQFYGADGITRWLVDINSVADGVNKLPDRFSIDSNVSMNLRYSPTASICPSESLRTVRDVVTAPASELEKRCKNCGSCQRVNTIQQISSLMKKTRREINNDDVYKFDGSDAEEQTTPFYLHRKRRNSRAPDSNIEPEPAVAKAVSNSNQSEEDEYHFYLDMLTDSPHVVQMTSIKVPNSKKRMMRARLVPRAEAHTTQDFSLTEHQGLFDQLLNTLRFSNSAQSGTNPESSASNSKEPEARTTEFNKSSQTEPSTSGITKSNLNKTPEVSSKKKVTRPTSIDKVSEPISKINKPNVAKPSTSRGSGKSQTTAKSNDTDTGDKTNYSNGIDDPKLVEAPVFHMTEEDFNDPISFFEKIVPQAAPYGLCKVVAPETFKPKCVLNDEFKFNVTNQYITRLYNRWGPAAREMCMIKAYLGNQNSYLSRAPLNTKLETLKVNLPKLYMAVQHHGGLNEVIEKKKWKTVAEEMRFTGPNVEKALDSYYVKYLLPYDAATTAERQNIMGAVEKCWNKKHGKLLDWALNPLHHQKKLLGESDSSDEESDDKNNNIVRALAEAEDCVIGGRSMNLSGFKKVASEANKMYLPHVNATLVDIEKEYWRLVLFGTDHVLVNSASIDTGASAYGFSKHDKTDPCGKHPWNLKMLSTNSGNVLRSLDAVLGVTVPTLHLGMLFSTSCWHRDPHGLPWMEYMHEGPAKIWYGIPDEQSSNFRKAVEALCPTSCQNKSIWLSSDITMIPPNLLREHYVSLSHAVQKPGEFIIVFPKAYSCSISTGFTVSESVYFATNSWLEGVTRVFQELRESCEPTTFSVEQLLIALGRDPRAPLSALRQVYENLSTIVDEEVKLRTALVQYKIARENEQHTKRRGTGAAWNVRELAECCICRKTLYLSKVTGLIARKTSLCLVHTVQLLKTPKYRNSDLSATTLVNFFTDKQLQEIVTAIHKRLKETLANTAY